MYKYLKSLFKEMYFPYEDFKNGNIKEIKSWIEKNESDVNLLLVGNVTPLHLAIQHNHFRIAQLLLAKGANTSLQNKDGNTALHYAAIKGYIRIINLLLANGADVNVKNKIGNTALHIALKNGHLEIARVLLDAGTDVNVKNKIGNTALHYAAQKDNLEIVNILLEKGADINAKNKDGNTALHIALKNGHSNRVKQLIAMGADVDAKDLDYAVKSNYLEIVNTLLANSEVDVNDKKYGISILHEAIETENLKKRQKEEKTILEKSLRKQMDNYDPEALQAERENKVKIANSSSFSSTNQDDYEPLAPDSGKQASEQIETENQGNYKSPESWLSWPLSENQTENQEEPDLIDFNTDIKKDVNSIEQLDLNQLPNVPNQPLNNETLLQML